MKVKMLRFRILNEPCSILARSILLSGKTLIYSGSKALTLYTHYAGLKWMRWKLLYAGFVVFHGVIYSTTKNSDSLKEIWMVLETEDRRHRIQAKEGYMSRQGA